MQMNASSDLNLAPPPPPLEQQWVTSEFGIRTSSTQTNRLLLVPAPSLTRSLTARCDATATFRQLFRKRRPAKLLF